MKIVIAGGTGLSRPAAGRRARRRRPRRRRPARREAAPRRPAPRRSRWTPDGSARRLGQRARRRRRGRQPGRRIDRRRRWTRGAASSASSTAASTRRAAWSRRSARAAQPAAVFVSGSAVGYYGPLGDEPPRKSDAAGRDFLAEVCEQWEAEAMRAQARDTRVVLLRTGLVLGEDGGALPPMLPPFWFGVGGPLGSGRQYWPWIHRDDWVASCGSRSTRRRSSGRSTRRRRHRSPTASSRRRSAARMHRPAFMPAPAFALRLLLGEMADALLLSGQRAVPARPSVSATASRSPISTQRSPIYFASSARGSRIAAPVRQRCPRPCWRS